MTEATLDLRVGGMCTIRVEAGDESFDFAWTYTRIVPEQLLEFRTGNRTVLVEFVAGAGGVTVRVTGDAESGNEIEPQRFGWQQSLKNFASYVETGQSTD